MKNDSAHLQPLHVSPNGQAVAPAAAEPTIVHLPLYRPGSRAGYEGRNYTVGHVVISRSQLLVYLEELGTAVNAEKLQISPTRVELKRH